MSILYEQCTNWFSAAYDWLIRKRFWHFVSYENIDEGMGDESLAAHARTISVNSQQQNEKFCSNQISTCKYTILSFPIRFLIEQFRRYNNVFFLIIALLQQIPNVSPTGRYTTAVPFLIILAISALKEIFEDLKRRKSDQKVNNFWTYVLKNSKWQKTRWKKVLVGDVVRVENGQLFPADMIILSSSEPQAMAYIETSNLDGETNLKIRQGLECTSELITLQSISAIKMNIECEQPNRHVNEFNGTLYIDDLRRPLGMNQFLLRGARLKNTLWICGVVIYTGHDAKLLKNSMTAPLKRSNIDVIINQRIIFLFIALLTLAIVSAIGAFLYEKVWLAEAYYLGISGLGNTTFFWNVLTFFILYNNLIPISLQVTLELVRFFQATYINNDIEMYDECSDTAAIARTSNLNEELGQVKFIMSDKTGTLTRNVMKFKRCSIGEQSYGSDDVDEFNDPLLLEKLISNDTAAESVRDFLRMMAVCHTVVPEKDETGHLTYQASSPDEGALVRGAAAIGFVFHTRKPQFLVIDAMGKEEIYQVLNILEFTSDRKRMGVIVKCQDGKIKLYVKGADTMIFERLSPDSSYRSTCEKHLLEYASKGYRTLCFATREIDENEYKSWAAGFEAASIAIENRVKLLVDSAENIEKDLFLVGASAIEDKLQEEVPETIRALMNAEIRIWVLTGDKRETAINIANAAALCSYSTKQLDLDTTTYDETYSKLVKLNDRAKLLNESKTDFILIADGCSLHYALTGDCRRLMGELALMSRSVVCCRMTPMQKAEVVELVRSSGNHVVLAIGDGANDVAMIQAANVGVGISGEEGLQAASASDYAIAQFRFLKRLLLVHGSWNFDRSVKVVLYSFYKNICLYLIELWFAFFSAFSGQTVFERWTIGLFNVAFTAFPPVFLGLFNRPVSAETMLNYPALYFSFQKRAFSMMQFSLWIGLAIWHSLILYFFSFGFLSNSVAWQNGRSGGWLMLGNSCYTFVVMTVCLKALLECDSWTNAILYSCFGSIILWIFFLTIYAIIWPVIPLGDDMAGMAYIMLTSYNFWLALILIPLIALLIDFLMKATQIMIFPTPRDLVTFSERGRSGHLIELCGYSNRIAHGTSVTVASSEANRGAVTMDRETRRSVTGIEDPHHYVPDSAKEENLRFGYAYSQEENGVVTQREIIRSYDSTSVKPRGL